MEIDVEPTAKVIDEMANTLEYYAKNMRQTAANMRERKNIEYAADALSDVANCVLNLRLDLIAARSIRSMFWAIADKKKGE